MLSAKQPIPVSKKGCDMQALRSDPLSLTVGIDRIVAAIIKTTD
jgi:hypothetical protein